MTSTSDSFVPIVSSSPPPIDFGSSEDEDDEFGTFSAAKVEFDSPPGKSSSNPLGNKHFFPIDVPHEDQDDNFQLSQSKPREDVLPVSTTSLGKLNINDGDDDTRTSTQIPNYQKFQASTKLDQPLPNGILHPGSLHDSSESLEFKQNEDNVHIKNGNFLQESNCHSIKSSVDKRKEDFKEDFKQFDTGENLHHELDDGEASSQSMKSDLEDQSGSNWAAFDTFHEKTDDSPGPVTEPKTDISSTSSSHENLPHNSEMKLEYLRNRDEDKRDASGFSVQQSIHKELPSEPLGMPSVAMENDDDGDDDDEFGDFGSSIKDDQSNSVNTPETDFKSEFERIDTNDDFGDFGSFESKPVTGIFNQESGHSKETFHSPTVITGSDSCVSEKEESLKLENLTKGSNDDDFDDDDFAEFSAFKRDSSESVKADEGTSQPTESQDNFGEFGAFKTESSTTDSTNGSDWANFGGSGSSSRTVDNFGNFDSFKVSSSNLKDGFDGDDDDDFASFESSRASSVSVGGSLRISQVFNGCFPNSINKAYPALTISLQPLSGLICQSKDSPSGAYGTNGSGLQLSTKSTNGLGVWSVLSDMENTKAMGYQWTKSDSKKKLLSSLGLDERNILTSRVGGVPKFASDLGMLQPIKPGEPPLQAEAAPRQEEAFPPEESVPKVEFDWSGSGLINPLDANKLNLDFFATETKTATPSSKNKSKTAPSIDPDILNLEAPSDPSPALAPSKPTFKPLDEILKTSSMSMVQQPLKRESNLSDEANKTLDSLPDLSFMLAKVLMFPIKSQSASEVQQIGGTLGGGSLLD